MTAKTPEILAPVGTWEMCVAAVQSGADAIYVGMPHFNARGRTEDLSIKDLSDMVTYCHLSGVKIYLAFNILIFEKEFESVIELLQQVLPLGIDALIVQDIGLVKLIKTLAPDQIVHASTQMTISSDQHIELISELGMSRYVLARELSLSEIEKIREKTSVPLEVFVHGALCVSYSGQCLTSESQGGRSANRGQCAQSCRLSYDLIVDGEKKDLKDKKYLVSPKDLCAIDDVEKLSELGIDSFKIEGRLKSPEYVATTVKAYKTSATRGKVSDELRNNMRIAYSRDFFNGWMDGVNHQKLVRADYSNNQGLELGRITKLNEKSINLESRHDLSPGDGVSFINFATGKRVGAFIYSFERLNAGEISIGLDYDLDLRQLQKGMTVFLNHSRRLESLVRSDLSNKKNMQQSALSAKVTSDNSRDLTLEITVSPEISVSVTAEGVLTPARNLPVTEEFVRNVIAALSGTPFYLAAFEYNLPAGVYVQEKALRQIRQKAVLKIYEEILGSKKKATFNIEKARALLSSESNLPLASKQAPQLSVLLREQEQVAAVLGMPLDTVYLDFEHGKDYDQACADLRAAGLKVGIATTRILKPAELGHLKKIERLKPDYILVRNLGALNYFKNSGLKLIGDFSLNASNSVTAKWLIEKGLLRITPSYDLNKDQLLDLLQNFPAEHCEITAHHYMPEFHMEHCVFAAFLSNGTSWRDCGRPCESHRVELRDIHGKIHPLKADAECRNTMFNGAAQSSIKMLPELINLGIKNFRLEALFETREVLKEKIQAYLDLINGNRDANAILSRFKITEKYGVTDGQLLSIGKYQDRKKTMVAMPALVAEVLETVKGLGN